MADPVSALARLEAEISAAITEHHEQIVGLVARALVEAAAREHVARNGNSGHVTGPKLCYVCGTNLAAPMRTVCGSCRGRMRRERERLRQAHAAELAAARAGVRGPRAAELATAARRDPAQPQAF